MGRNAQVISLSRIVSLQTLMFTSVTIVLSLQTYFHFVLPTCLITRAQIFHTSAHSFTWSSKAQHNIYYHEATHLHIYTPRRTHRRRVISVHSFPHFGGLYFHKKLSLSRLLLFRSPYPIVCTLILRLSFFAPFPSSLSTQHRWYVQRNRLNDNHISLILCLSLLLLCSLPLSLPIPGISISWVRW